MVAKEKVMLSLQQAQATHEKSRIEEALRESSQQVSRFEVSKQYFESNNYHY